MPFSRRAFLETGFKAGIGAGAAALSPGAASGTQGEQADRQESHAFDSLKPLGDRVRPITADEYQGRIAQAQRLMREAKPPFAALYILSGSSMFYYTGIRWAGGERPFALLIPQKTDPLIISPAFEEARARELLRWDIELRAWQEDESPYALVAKSLADRGVRTGLIGVEEATRFFFYDGLRRAAPAYQYAIADPVTAGCRERKSAHELELMRLACEATVAVYRAAFPLVREGMMERDVGALVSQGFARMGLSGGVLVLFGEWAARPHGTSKPQKLAVGRVVLLDGGTTVEGYASDVTRCTVLGKPPEKLQRAFETLRRAQDAALAAAVPGRLSGSVDDAARRVITEAGYGAGYQLFTHRVGHGIGLDGHEHPYLVRGSTTVLEPGMTFSNEPGIYVQGEYGLRLEDDMVIAEKGPAHLLTPGFSESLEKPCG